MARIYEKLAICGGEGGRVWDDGVYDEVRKVFVGQDLSRITYVKFEYVKEDGEVVTREYGTTDQHPKEFAIEDPDEFLVAVEGSYNKVGLYATEVITSLVFKTSKGRVSPTFGQNLLGLVAGTKFSFEGKKIVGFHGRSDKALDALGVYFVLFSMGRPPYPLYRLSAQGGTEGSVWDDGNALNHVIIKTLRICQDDCRITYLEVEYEIGGKLETRKHGVKGEKTPSEFLLDSPDEYIISVEATYQKPSFFRNTVITSLKLETSKGRTSFFGYEVGKKFVLEQKDCVLVGFHGKEGEAIDALGAYFAQIPIPSASAPTPAPAAPAPTAPTPAVGGIVAWDDGVYDNVKKIYVEEVNYSITFVKFEYVKGTSLVSGDDHGKKTSPPEVNVKEYVLEDDEYITGVDGYKNTRDGVDVVIGLLFKTNKRVLTPPCGIDIGDKFWLGRPDHKIVGFHGKASHVIHNIGASVERVIE